MWRDLVHSSGKTSHFENYRYNCRSSIIGFGELSLETSATSRLRSYVSGINITNSEASGLDATSSPISTSTRYLCRTANILLPQQAPTSYSCRQITRAPREEQHDINFIKDIYWPQLSDDIDFKTIEHFHKPPEAEHRYTWSTTARTSGWGGHRATSGCSTSSLTTSSSSSCTTSRSTSTADRSTTRSISATTSTSTSTTYGKTTSSTASSSTTSRTTSEGTSNPSTSSTSSSVVSVESWHLLQVVTNIDKKE